MAAAPLLILRIQTFGISTEPPYIGFDQKLHDQQVIQLKREAFENYRRNRENGEDQDSPRPCPEPLYRGFQISYYNGNTGNWVEYRQNHAINYTHVRAEYFEENDIQIQRWMEEKDIRYLRRIRQEDPALYQQITTHQA